MFGSVEPTEYDLKFELFGIPVRVSPWFWGMAAILGFESTKIGISYLIAWMGVVFVSVMVHEFGHALLARAFGYPPRILLYQFGGLAFFEPRRDFTHRKSILISFAGPFAGFTLYALVWIVARTFSQTMAATLSRDTLLLINFVILQMLYVNLWWGILNLLPVVPLDGGQICRDICLWITPRNGVQLATQIGVFVAGGVAVWFFMEQRFYPAVLFGMLCASNLSTLRARYW